MDVFMNDIAKAQQQNKDKSNCAPL